MHVYVPVLGVHTCMHTCLHAYVVYVDTQAVCVDCPKKSVSSRPYRDISLLSLNSQPGSLAVQRQTEASSPFAPGTFLAASGIASLVSRLSVTQCWDGWPCIIIIMRLNHFPNVISASPEKKPMQAHLIKAHIAYTTSVAFALSLSHCLFCSSFSPSCLPAFSFLSLSFAIPPFLTPLSI